MTTKKALAIYSGKVKEIAPDDKVFGLIGNIGTADVAIANSETVVVSYSPGANELRVGSTFRFEAYCTQAGTNAATPTIRIRIGTVTLTGNIAATLTGVVGTSNVPSFICGLITIRSTGAGGTAIGSLQQIKSGVLSAANAATSTVAVDTTSGSNKIELTFISGQSSNTYTFRNAVIYQVN